MRYLSVCSGIEAATVAWHPLGWEAAAYSEIEAFPRAVLKHHYPDTPLHGDFTTIEGDEYGTVDLLVGGTPCQSFSVAGLRKGLEDDRGNLTLQFLKLAQRTKPEWIVWENVPGVLSDKTGALPAFLDGLEELGYICDIDILDAQFYGVPQRRRRVFVCGQHRDHLIARRTDSSALTIAQCWQETLHGILDVQSRASANEPESSASASLSRDGVTRRMKLFGLLGESDSFETLRVNLVAAWQRSAAERNIWAAHLGASGKEPTAEGQSTASPTASPFTLTEASLSAVLAESYAVMKSFITSTTTSSTTQTEIYTCSQAVLHIARLTLALNHSSPPFWSAASSSLTALRGFIDYARSTGSDLFAGVEWFRAWGDFLGQAVPLLDAFERLGIASFGTVLPLADSLSGNPAPRREKGTRVAARTANGVGTCGADDNQGQAGHLIPSTGEVSHCLNAGGMGRQDYETETLIAHSLRAEGFDASEDGTGRGTPIIPIDMRQASRGATMTNNRAEGSSGGAPGTGIGEDGDPAPTVSTSHPPAVCFTAKDHGADASDISPTLRSGSHSGSHANGGVMPAVAFTVSGPSGGFAWEKPYASAVMATPPSDTANTQTGVRIGSAVRRLTPTECERLQGFPDDYTLIPHRGKPAADGPRYRALGNSMAVPVMSWLGQRIQLVDSIPLEDQTRPALSPTIHKQSAPANDVPERVRRAS
jgi:DNA-cytosine methyltransferase